MTRCIDYRVKVAVPPAGSVLHTEVLDILDIQFSDNEGALSPDKDINHYVPRGKQAERIPLADGIL